jgi:hypothetical protein
MTASGMVYEWKPKARCPVKAQVAGEELEKIRVRDGILTTGAVVKAARPKKSPLHPAFDWDDKIAAAKWRDEQASYMIRNITVKIADEDEDSEPTRAFYSVREDDDNHYQSLAVAFRNKETRAQILNRALEELETWERRYEHLVELAAMFSTIKRAKKKIKKSADLEARP